MAFSFHLLVLIATIILSDIPTLSSASSSSLGNGLTRGSSLSVEHEDDILVSPNGLFTAGFHQVGDNAYGFAVWVSEQAAARSPLRTVVWMANRDEPVNGKQSKLSLREDGNLVLSDAGQNVIWSTQTKSPSSISVQLQLNNTGNLVLHAADQGPPLWQSFDNPTDTLLPNQLFNENTTLVSSRSSKDYSSGFYKLVFDHDSILRLLYRGPETTAIYWPDPRSVPYEAGRFLYLDSRRASFDSYGQFKSSDGLQFVSADYGRGPLRIMKIDVDGNLRVYSFVGTKWEVQWQAISHTCRINGACGPNSLCTYSQDSGRKCTCLYGYKMVNSQDWTYGCEPEPEFELCEREDNCDFIELQHVEFYGHDIQFLANYTLDACKKNCLKDITCKGFQFGFTVRRGCYYCFLKSSLHNGYQMGYDNWMFIKVPKRKVSTFDQKNTNSQYSLSCARPVDKRMIRSYEVKHDNALQVRLLLVIGGVIGFIEILCVVTFCYCTSNNRSSATEQMYFPAPTGFRKFTYSELKKASSNFNEEIGRGGACVVYKGRLSDNRIAAIKMLNNTSHQGEAEFQAEISPIGRVNHMNLIQMWGYCSEGKHRLVVYEHMENGSLSRNLRLGKLDWSTRVNIAIGTAKGLAYLHEDCLEWVLHCDVKPHNILLDDNYEPKVADFGLCKLLDRCDINQWNFSMIRGTRGYMAPEWVLNLPITSKVDVFSYGVVILEMITGRSPADMHQTSNEDRKTDLSLINWVRDRVCEFDASRTISWVDEIVDPSIKGKYDHKTIEDLIRIALQCAEEDREARPTMSQVVDLLLHL